MNLSAILTKVAEYRKAVAALLGPVVPFVVLALDDNVITPSEIVTIIAGALGIGGLVAALPNAKAAVAAAITTFSVQLPQAHEVADEPIDLSTAGR